MGEGGSGAKAARRMRAGRLALVLGDSAHAATHARMSSVCGLTSHGAIARAEDLQKVSGAGLYDSIANVDVGDKAALGYVNILSSTHAHCTCVHRRGAHVRCC